MAASVILALSTYFIGRLLKLKRPLIGALMLTTAFSAAALIGYSLIRTVFAGNQKVIADAIVTTEIGVGLPVLILGPIIARFFGETTCSQTGYEVVRQALKDYLLSPIFISFVVAVLLSLANISGRFILFNGTLAKLLEISAGALTLLPAVIIGLRLKFTACRRILPLIAISAVLQLICKPFLIYWLAGWAPLPPPEKTVLTILSTMPSGLVPAAFAANYNCAPDETSAIIFVNVALSAITIPVLLSILL